MKKYFVKVKFINGTEIEFETNTNIKLVQPILINGQRCLVTEDEYVINLSNVERIEQTEIR